MNRLKEAITSAKNFKKEALEIFGKHETSKFRTITIEQTKKNLKQLSIRQDKLFSEAIGCIEKGFYRASIVIAWAGFIDCIESILESDGMKKVHTLRPNWKKFKNIEMLKESISEYQIIEVAKDTGLLTKSECKTLHGLLSKRNECAHPTNFEPSLNDSLGYISELLNRLENILKRKY